MTRSLPFPFMMNPPTRSEITRVLNSGVRLSDFVCHPLTSTKGSGASGDYVITAVVTPYTGPGYEASYTVSVSTQAPYAPNPNQNTPDPPTTYQACGIHETGQSGDHSYITPACGISSHAGYACQLSSDHATSISGYRESFYECQPHQTYGCGHTDLDTNAFRHQVRTCPINSNGDQCLYSPYYLCDRRHRHKYPRRIACGARSWTQCAENVSSTTQHQITCVAGHTYWSCSSTGVAAHATPIKCKRPGCSATLTKCQNIRGVGCNSNGRTYLYHNIY